MNQFRRIFACARRAQVFKRRRYSFFCDIKSKIKMTGPISIAEYMREVLTNPKGGYYMKNDVFGMRGDFITSPEISQMFGEVGKYLFNYIILKSSNYSTQ